MLNNKIITLILACSFVSALGAETESVTNIDHPPAYTNNLSNQIESQINSQSTNLENSNTIKNTKSYDSLEEFIYTAIQLSSEKTYGVHQDLLSNDNKFQYLNIKEMLLKTDLNSSKDSKMFYNSEINRLKKMQKLAMYISVQYNVPLIKAEKIVYVTFLESLKKDLDPLIVLSLIDVESTFQQFSKSSAGAVGLTQVMAKIHKNKIGELNKENMDIWSIHGNIKVGTQILKEYVSLANGNLKKALQMYNGTSHDINYKYSNKIMTRVNIFNKISTM